MVRWHAAELVQKIPLVFFGVDTSCRPGKNGWHLAVEYQSQMQQKQLRAVRKQQEDNL
jgi:hypothetical protein